MPKSESERIRSSGGAPSEYRRPFVVAWLSHEYCQCVPPSSLKTRPKFAATMICCGRSGGSSTVCASGKAPSARARPLPAATSRKREPAMSARGDMGVCVGQRMT